KIAKVFNAFEQLQTSITRRFGGLGLGLAISKAMVDAHGGKIGVHSDGKDKGAVFTITLRAVAEPATAQHDGHAPTEPSSNEAGKRSANEKMHHILVVDDHHDTCTGMKMMLERRGYDITVAHTADQAVEKARAQDFDLL